jgi:uncharacterized protein
MGRADRPGEAPSIVRVAVAFSPHAGAAFEIAIELPAPATALAAVRASGVLERHPALARGEPLLGIWGRACASEAPIQDGDRVEIYRPLAMDPNEARRLRARKRPPGGGR